MGQCGRRPEGDVITGEAKLMWRAEHEPLQTAPCRSDASDMGERGGEGAGQSSGIGAARAARPGFLEGRGEGGGQRAGKRWLKGHWRARACMRSVRRSGNAKRASAPPSDRRGVRLSQDIVLNFFTTAPRSLSLPRFRRFPGGDHTRAGDGATELALHGRGWGGTGASPRPAVVFKAGNSVSI